MASIDLHGLLARLHRRGEQDSPSQGRVTSASRIFALLLVAAVAGGSFFLTQTQRTTPDAHASALPELPETVGSTLPLHMNERVEKWVERFHTDQRPAFERLLRRQGVYAGMIRSKLRARGMPEELLYLAMMESGLSPFAVSRVSAVGVWQFMGPTAQQYGLRVDEWVDARRDPVRATDAALDYLSYLRDRFGSWYLAAAAYNAGPNRVERVLRRHADGRSGDEQLYWEVLEHLPPETREYVPRLVAATYIAENPGEFGFDVESDAAYEYDRVFVPGGTSLAQVAHYVRADARLLRTMNPHLVRGITPPDELYPVRVPVGATPAVVASLMGDRSGASGIRVADD